MTTPAMLADVRGLERLVPPDHELRLKYPVRVAGARCWNVLVRPTAGVGRVLTITHPDLDLAVEWTKARLAE